ncbi:L-gulonolactone oxidase-like isoform X2 [Mytilus californianus]|uniref:L-gulonolactone oxidase-like isoform X2 n=1 Tax=Mytilus californianus TaxID=6549 RepID=UPI002246F9C9|nr:L-gulonolactone oxidase-like isoform X2 [Mytilus californianus]
MGCGASSQEFHPVVVKHDKPSDNEQLKSCLKNALGDKKIAILELGDRDNDWIKGARCNDQQIVMVDCKALYEEQMKNPKAKHIHPDLSDQGDIEDRLYKLQKRIGNSPSLQIETFENWGETQAIQVISTSPTTKEELQKLVLAASEEGLRVRCAGTGHSWAPLFADSKQLLIYVKDLKSDYKDGSRIRISNRKKREVDIMTGVTTGDFKKFQIKNKLHIPANVILDVVQMVSVVATGCHGVGRDANAPSDNVVKMRIIGSDGKLQTYTSDDKEMLRAISANFGCFGVIFDMTIKLIPEVIVKVENRYMDLDELFFNAENIQKLFEENWSIEIFWFPYNSLSLFDYNPKNDDVWIRVINKETKAVKTATQTYYDWKEVKDYLTGEAMAIMSPIIAGNPSLTPLYAWSTFGAIKNIIYPSGTQFQELPHAVHFRQYIEKAPVYDMEFAFDLRGDFHRLLKIIQVVVNKVDHYEEKDEYPLNIALEMRMMGYSDTLLCPGIIGNPTYGGSGHVVYIEILSVVDTKGWEKFCTDVGREWMALDGVPHLAKQWDFLPGVEEHIYKHMGQHINAFKEQLNKSGADQNGMFLNKSLKKLLRL